VTIGAPPEDTTFSDVSASDVIAATAFAQTATPPARRRVSRCGGDGGHGQGAGGGICQVDVEVQGPHQPLHSGSGGPVPDPVQILCAMIADLRKPNGALDVPGLYAKVARPNAKRRARIRRLPLSEAKFKDTGLLPGVGLWGESQYSLLERQWTRLALTVMALEARPSLRSSNQIIERHAPARRCERWSLAHASRGMDDSKDEEGEGTRSGCG
jgi:hypothetical protein